MTFNIHTNNCYHYVAKQYESYFGRPLPVSLKNDNPEKPLQTHRAALRAVKHFGLASGPKEGCIVLMSFKNAIHHTGFYRDGKIHSLTEYGLKVGDESVFKAMGFTLFKYLEVK